MENEFMKELDELIKCTWKRITPILIENSILSVVFDIDKGKTDELIKKYIGNGSEKFSIQIYMSSNECEKNRAYSTFNGNEVKPIGHYIKPDNYKKVSEIEILKQCIIQNTHRPDIRKLECNDE